MNPLGAPDDRAVPARWLPALAVVAGARSLAQYWDALDELLQLVAPHSSAVASHLLATVMFGVSAGKARARSIGALREQAGSDLSVETLDDRFFEQMHDWALTGRALYQAMEIASSSDPVAVNASDIKRNAEYYRRHIEPMGWAHALLLPFGEIDAEDTASIILYRSGEEAPFSAAEVDAAQSLQPILRGMLERHLDMEGRHTERANVRDILADLPIGLMLFDWRWQPILINDEGYRQAKLWNQSPDEPLRSDFRVNFRLPEDIRHAGQRLQQRWLGGVLGIGALPRELVERLPHPAREDMEVTLGITGSGTRQEGLPMILARFSGMAPRGQAVFTPTPSQIAVLAQLTPGERNVALLVMRGLSNREIANALNRDITTVKDHLGHIYGKLGIRGRTELAVVLANR